MSLTHNPNQMIVEGNDDKHSVISLMKSHVNWPKLSHEWPVHIHMGNGAEEILKDGVLMTYLKGSTVKKFGIMLDADSKPNGRYGTLRNICAPMFPYLPEALPADGAVVENDEGQRLGIWIMPDNTADGDLETFLKHLVPPECKTVWDHAVQSVETAIKLGAPLTATHREKANLYTWLAWQNPSAQHPGMALTQKILDPKSETAKLFVEWFKKLYGLQPLETLFALT